MTKEVKVGQGSQRLTKGGQRIDHTDIRRAVWKIYYKNQDYGRENVNEKLNHHRKIKDNK